MSLATTAAKVGMKLKGAAPDILVIGGIAGVIVGTAMIVKKSREGNAVIDEGRFKIVSIEDRPENLTGTEVILTKESKTDIHKTKIDTAKKLLRIYAPWVGLEAVSIFAILYGHKLIKGKLLAVTTAYKALDESYRALNRRIKDELGEEKAGKLKNGIVTKEVEVSKKDKDGNATTQNETVDVVDGDYSPYARFFDQGCMYFNEDPTLNLMFLREKQNELTTRLERRGYVTLNEVYYELDIPETKEFGTHVGWVKGHGDNKVAFDIYNIHKRANRDFVNGYEPAILLDFNVDSVDISGDMKREFA